MKHLPAMIGTALLFYAALFLFQLGFYFFSPSLYVTSLTQIRLPDFILWSFAGYFGLVFLMYMVWALLLGTWNALLLNLNRPHQPRRIRKNLMLSFLLLCLAQFLGTLLCLGYLHPSAFQAYPLLRHLPLALSYSLLTGGILVIAYYFLSSRTQWLSRGVPQVLLSLLLPMGVLVWLHHESDLHIPPARNAVQQGDPDILLIGIDALDGDTGNELLQKQLKDQPGTLFTNAFTPLPLTHPAWTSILTGLYPKNHGVRYFFDSPLKSTDPDLFLPKILQREKNYLSLFASDQPETSYFTGEMGFTAWVQDRIGWEAHMVVTILNQFLLPAIWLNNPWVERMAKTSFNYAGLFNFDPNRFINYTFEKFSELGPSQKLLAFHTCALHSPIRLSLKELQTIPRYWALAPSDFSFAKWPRPGWPQRSTPKDWINPYFIRRSTVLDLLGTLLSNLESTGYMRNHLVVVLSDHGERFIEDREVYGGVHGVDLRTREQNNVVLAIFDGRMKDPLIRRDLVSLIDLTPTLLQRLGIATESMGFDGMPLLSQQGEPHSPPGRPLWVESMGYIDDHRERGQFPQFNFKSLGESLRYGQDGKVVIDEEYYARILLKKETADLSKNHGLWN